LAPLPAARDRTAGKSSGCVDGLFLLRLFLWRGQCDALGGILLAVLGDEVECQGRSLFAFGEPQEHSVGEIGNRIVLFPLVAVGNVIDLSSQDILSLVEMEGGLVDGQFAFVGHGEKPKLAFHVPKNVVNVQNGTIVIAKDGSITLHEHSPEFLCRGVGFQCGVDKYQQKCAEFGVELTHEQADMIVRQWRSARPMTTSLWYELDKCAKNAIRNPGGVFAYKRVAFRRDGWLLQMRIPSGRTLCYRSPEIVPVEINGRQREEIWYLNNKGNRDKLYGGKLTENLTQAVARDLLANAIFNVEVRGYPVVLHVHDELVAEVPTRSTNISTRCSATKNRSRSSTAK